MKNPEKENPAFFDPLSSPLLTDLYQLTMLEGYLAGGLHDKAAFEFFMRRLPLSRGFLIACGLDTLLKFVESMRFSEAELEYLASARRFSPGLIEYLSKFRFTGDIWAMPEGTICFADEPIVRVEAPIMEAQLVESRLINILHFETMIAGKAARCRLAARLDTALVAFGLRRAHGAEAGLLAARAAYIAGFTGTSNVMAEAVYGIPIFGTMAHSFIEAHDDETKAFIDFARANPANTTLLIDTYDTRRGAEKALEAARILAREGIRVQAVRLDSGDLLTLSIDVRKILDRGGFPEIRIFASSSLDEYAVRDLLACGAPIDGFGIGTKLDTSADAPYLDCAYKLVEYAGKPRFKTSEGKMTLPGRKQVFRQYEAGEMVRDILDLEGIANDGVPLLVKVMESGKRLQQPRDLREIAAHAREETAVLPPHLKALETEPPYPVAVAPALNLLKETLRAAVK